MYSQNQSDENEVADKLFDKASDLLQKEKGIPRIRLLLKFKDEEGDIFFLYVSIYMKDLSQLPIALEKVNTALDFPRIVDFDVEIAKEIESLKGQLVTNINDVDDTVEKLYQEALNETLPQLAHIPNISKMTIRLHNPFTEATMRIEDDDFTIEVAIRDEPAFLAEATRVIYQHLLHMNESISIKLTRDNDLKVNEVEQSKDKDNMIDAYVLTTESE